MKKSLRLLALITLLSILLTGLSLPAYAETGSSSEDSITLLYSRIHNNFPDKTYSFSQMRSEVKGTLGLLRNSFMDRTLSYCDMSDVYNAIDLMVMHGAAKAKLPLTKDQYDTIDIIWNSQCGLKKLYPMMNAITAKKNSDGTYTLSLLFSNKGNKDDEEMAYSRMISRGVAVRVVESMPKSCKTDYEKAEYLYNYVTQIANYYDGENHDKWYYDTGFFIDPLNDALIKNETVCAGFAYTFAFLCELTGIDAQYVIVKPKNSNVGSHAVVIAKIDGKNYWFDPTYDEDESMRGFNWFGLSDSEFKKNHDCPTTYYSRDLYPSCPSELKKPSGYWDIDMMKYRELGNSTIEKGRYIITSAMNNNMVLEIGGYSKERGGNAQVWYNSFIDFQQFDIYKDGNSYKFRNCGSSLELEVLGEKAKSGANVHQYSKKNNNAQKWSLENAGDGYYYIKSSLGKLYLEVEGSSINNGSNVRIASYTGKDNQKWRFTKSYGETIKEGRYSISSAMNNNKVLGPSNYSDKENINIVIWYNCSNAFQQFDVFKDKDNRGYILKNCGSSLVAAYLNYGKTSSFNVCQHAIDYSGFVRTWAITNAGDGYYYIKSYNKDLYLEVAGSNAGDGANVQVAPFTGKDNQKWRLNLIAPYK